MKIQKTALIHDSGKVYAVGTENECLVTLHKVSGQSWDYSLKHGGYSLVSVEIETGEMLDEITAQNIKDLSAAFYASIINKTISNREKEINKNLASIEIEKHHDMYTANIYDKDGNGYQLVLTAWNGHKPGDITN